MNLRFSSFHAPALSPNQAGKLSRIGAALILAAGVAGSVPEAGAAPKATATPTATATATPTPSPVPTATPKPAVTANYSGTQQAQYMATARDAFIALRTAKVQPFLDAHKALDDAGSMSTKGLKTRADIAARRDLIAKTLAANDAYQEFVKTQEDTYRAELAKTPLTPDDADSILAEYTTKANTSLNLKLRETQRDVLKAGDDMLAALDKKFGSWSVNDSGKLLFKKKADVNAMNALSAKFNAKVVLLQPLRDQLAQSANPTPAGSPGAAPAASASPTAPATPAASAKPEGKR